MNTIKIGNKTIGNGKPTFIIAEAGLNHNGQFELAKKLVDVAKEAGADAVKFQTYKTEEIATKKALTVKYQGKKTSQYKLLKKLELSYEDFIKLKEHCDEKRIIFLSTPHSESAVDFLDKLVPAYKIGSGDLTNIPFLKKIAEKRKPIILSTGMATLKEVKEAVNIIKSKGNSDIIVLHCTTSYPCERKNANLKIIQTLQKRLNILIGYSDHTLGIDASLAATKLGAVIVEKHFTLDKKVPGANHKASLNPDELKKMVDSIRENKEFNIPLELLGGGIKKPTNEELNIAKAVRKSITAKKDIQKGEKITEEMITIKRPANGIPPKHIKEIIGKIAVKNIREDEQIKWNMIK